MQTPTDFPTVPLAHVGPVNDLTLDRLIHHADDAAGGFCTQDGATAIILCMPALLRELRDRRRAMLPHAEPCNVHYLGGPAA